MEICTITTSLESVRAKVAGQAPPRTVGQSLAPTARDWHHLGSRAYRPGGGSRGFAQQAVPRHLPGRAGERGEQAVVWEPAHMSGLGALQQLQISHPPPLYAEGVVGASEALKERTLKMDGGENSTSSPLI